MVWKFLLSRGDGQGWVSAWSGSLLLCCASPPLAQVHRRVVGKPAVSRPEGLGLRRLGAPAMVGSPLAGVLRLLDHLIGCGPRRGLGRRLGGEARKGRNPPSFSYTLYSGLLLLLGCRSAIHGAACYAEKAT